MQRLSSAFLPRIALSDGTAEALKYLAAVLMVLDHVNGFLLGESIPAFSLAGRLAFPLFAFIFGRNLARPGLLETDAAARVATRLLLFGCAASLPYVYLLGMRWTQLNILFTLCAGAVLVRLLHRGRRTDLLLAALLFLAAGRYVDYMWPGLALCVASWAYCRNPSDARQLLWLACMASLYVINQNFAALLAAPLLWLASQRELSVTRRRHFFYWFYPVHLLAIGLLARM